MSLAEVMLLHVRVAVKGHVVALGFRDAQILSVPLAFAVKLGVVELTGRAQRDVEILNNVVAIDILFVRQVIGFGRAEAI